MKRCLSLLLSLVLLSLLLAGCSPADNDKNEPSVDVYYLTAEGGLDSGSAVGRVTYTAAHRGDLLHEALVRLAEDPDEKTKMQSAFPPDLHINTYSLDGREITIDLSETYQTLTPVQKTLVRCCLVMTLCSMEEVDRVTITVEGKTVETGLTLEILLWESAAQSEYQTELELWFPARDGSCLLSERRQLTIAQDKPLAEYAAEELLRGPQRSDAAPAAPEGTVLLSVHISGDTCTVDLSEAYYSGRPVSPRDERLMIYALVNTMTSLPGVDLVQITVEGRRLAEYVYIRLSEPLPRAEEFTYPNLLKWNWFTVDLYLEAANGKLVAVPVPTDDHEYPDTLTMTGRAVELLLSLDRTWGYRSPVPEGTRLMSIELQERICVLQLSREFLSGDSRQRTLAAEALAATAIGVGNYQGVQIMVENELYGDGKIYRREGEWFVDG